MIFRSARSSSSCDASCSSKQQQQQQSRRLLPKGWMAVYVGQQENRRFVIPVAYLKHPIVLDLLKKAEEEFGFYHNGAIYLPCDVTFFYNLLKKIESENAPKLPIGLMVM